jgi:dnd system-associated protein 4
MRNIRRSSRHNSTVDTLAEAKQKDNGQTIFPTLRDLLCFAAVLGYQVERKRPLIEPFLPFVDGRIFENEPQAPELMFLIGLAETKDVDCLREENEDSLVSLFEEYADGGLEVLAEWLKETPSDPAGDRDILEALKRYGYLELQNKPPEAVAAEIEF